MLGEGEEGFTPTEQTTEEEGLCCLLVVVCT
jgi:hypothetical protein